MKTSVKVATVLLYLLCFAALFMPYHIDALSQQPISGIDLMFGYSIHENPIKGEWIFSFIFLVPMLLGAVFAVIGKIGGSASIVSAFVGFGMSLFNYFMNSKESVKGTKFSMVLYAIVAIVGIAGFILYRVPYAEKESEEAVEIPKKEINPMDAPPRKYGPLKTPEPFVKKEPSVKIEPIKRPEPPKPSNPATVNISSVDKYYNRNEKKPAAEPDMGATKVIAKKEKTDYEDFYHKPIDFDYFLEKYKKEHSDD